MSLYLTYRPQLFADVIGQDHVVTTLEQAVKTDKLAHAYLFAGSRGTGKTSVARILAKTIMTQGIEDEAIRKQIIKGIEEGHLVDLMEIDAASNRGIDDIRDLIEKIQFSPVVASAKVYIVDEVHMLTKEAFNALLKTLEEPPKYAYFILATTELNKIPATIQSRCQCFPFRSIRDEDIIRRLQFIVDSEKISVDREALRAIAAHVEGGMRDAISLLDQLRSLDHISLLDVEIRAGSTGHEYSQHILSAIEKNDTKELLEQVRKVEEAGIALDIFTRQLLGDIRTQLHANIEGGTDINWLTNALSTLLNAIRDIRISPVPGVVLESALLSLCTIEGNKTVATTPVEKKVEAPVEPPKKKGKEAPNEPTTPEAAPEPVAEPKKEAEPATSTGTVEAPEISLESIQKNWTEIVKQTEPASVRMSLKNGRVIKVEGHTITVAFSSSFHKDKVDEAAASRKVDEIMERIFKSSLKISCVLDTATQTDDTPDKGMVNLADAASEIF